MQITKELLKEWSACRDGYGWFVSKFPQGAAYTEVSAALRADKRYADDTWLASNAFRFLFNAPELIENFVKADVDALIAAVQPSIDSTLAASGNDSALAASGNDSRLAASGNDSTLEAKGNCSVAMAAGLGSIAAAGEKGAFAIAWKDSSEQMRIAVGIVGENGIKASVLYRVGETGELEEVAQ